MFCLECGAKLDKWTKFCPSCGNEVKRTTEDVPSREVLKDTIVSKKTGEIPPRKKEEDIQLGKRKKEPSVINVNTRPSTYSISVMVILGTVFSMVAFFVPFSQTDIMGFTDDSSYISMINEIGKSAASIRNYSSNYFLNTLAPSVSNYFTSLANDAVKVQIILCIPIVLSLIALIYSFNKIRKSGLFAILSGLSMALIVAYVSQKYGSALEIGSEFTSLRIGALLYIVGIILTLIGQAGFKKGN